jgi:2-polyprenyl-3-methyl-5-hydroxy-6-metoxy-1,4-benzoquinol methylase
MTVGHTKPAGYYTNARRDLLDALPRPITRVLDVGCGAGEVGRGLRAVGAGWLSGVELDPAAAACAREIYDEVLVGTIEQHVEELSGPFDTICCYDVLEHLPDPYSVLRALLELAAPGAHLHVSVPNARHYSLVWDLIVRGTFGYTDWGHRDSTHLRWFTRRDIEAAIQAGGWQVIATDHPALHRSTALDRLTRGFSTEFLVGQWYVLARRPA